MKEEKFYLNVHQIRFLKKVLKRIEAGWDKYGWNTQQGISRALVRGTYDRGNKEYYNELRRDYIQDFCK